MSDASKNAERIKRRIAELTENMQSVDDQIAELRRLNAVSRGQVAGLRRDLSHALTQQKRLDRLVERMRKQ